MTEGEKTMRRLIAEPKPDPQKLMDALTVANLFILAYVVKVVYWPMYLLWGWGIIPK